MRIVVIGAGVGGLAAALALGRDGHEVTVVDRDPGPPLAVAEAFSDWRRQGVRQWRQYHIFLARARAELMRAAPDVVQQLLAVGAEERDLRAAVPGGPHEQDHELRMLAVRRPVFEWVLRSAVERSGAVRIVAGVSAGGLEIEPVQRRVRGVRTSDREVLPADVVVDAGGRRSAVREWLMAAGFECPPVVRVPCGIGYHSRYFRAREQRWVPQFGLTSVDVADFGFMGYGIALGDAGTFGVMFGVPSEDRELRHLSQPAVWDAIVALIPRLVDAVDPSRCEPIMEPAPMYGMENTLAAWRADGRQLPRGLVPIGDAWLATNPIVAWGASIAVGHAFDLARAIATHGTEVDAAIDHFHDGHVAEVVQRFALACEEDRARAENWDRTPPHRTDAERERQALSFALRRLAKRGDEHIARRLIRRATLLDPPDELWADRDAVVRARAELRAHPYDPHRHDAGPTRAEVVDAVLGSWR